MNNTNLIAFPLAFSDLTETSLEEISKILVGVVIHDGADPLAEKIKLHAIRRICELTEERIDALAIVEARKYGKDDSVMYGCSFTVRQSGDKLDYEVDPVCKDLKEKLRRRQDVIKAIHKAGGNLVDENTGEVTKPLVLSHSREQLMISHREKKT